MAGLLGCPQNYSAEIRTSREGVLLTHVDKLASVEWSRTLNDVSEATITIPAAALDVGCCEKLADVEPWVHDLIIYRDGNVVWEGPIQTPTFKTLDDTLVIEAQDMFAWLDHALVNTHVLHYDLPRMDASLIAFDIICRNLTDPLLSNPPDYCRMLDYIVAEPLGVPTSFRRAGPKADQIWTEYVGAIIKDLSERGFTITTTGRSLLFRRRKTDEDPALVRLTLDDIQGGVEIIKSGNAGATNVFCTTQAENQAPGDKPGKTVMRGLKGTIPPRLDLLVRTEAETDDNGNDITDPVDMRTIAAMHLGGRYPVPLSLSLPDSATLTPNAPVDINDLVGGERIDVVTTGACIDIIGGYRISDVNVTWSDAGETVRVSLAAMHRSIDDDSDGAVTKQMATFAKARQQAQARGLKV